MYTAYFGLKEKPFSIAPDPQYLFMSDRHREALAHLTYGLGDAGGFVLLTGEVGTGKTTVSRCLMERLPENTQAAFILNPTLSSHELLATICDELKIRYRKTGATLKTLTDKIQDKLLKNHKEGVNTLLIIDEAQHLQPEVLEQLRLLTNLETNTKKLLQVILIGQPELQTLLKRRDLRQLAQRITARYHLMPLNREEVAQYIKHRLSIAECIRAVFSKSAMNTIHDICGGIPRLINLVCERALLNAYSSNVATVDKKIVLISAREALGDEYQVHYWWQHRSIKWLCGLLLVSAVAAGAYFTGSNKENISFFEEKPKNETSKASVKPVTKVVVEKTNNSETLTEYEAAEHVAVEQETAEQETVEPAPKEETIDENPTPKIIEEKTQEVVKNEPEAETKNDVSVANEEVTNQQVNTVVAAKKVQQPKKLSVENVEGVSSELLDKFKKALNEVDTMSDTEELSSSTSEDISPIEKMPTWVQNGVPKLQFEQHIYASDGQGWVKVNGRDRYEGDNIARELILVRILPQKVVLNFRGEKFSMPALSSW